MQKGKTKKLKNVSQQQDKDDFLSEISSISIIENENDTGTQARSQQKIQDEQALTSDSEIDRQQKYQQIQEIQTKIDEQCLHQEHEMKFLEKVNGLKLEIGHKLQSFYCIDEDLLDMPSMTFTDPPIDKASYKLQYPQVQNQIPKTEDHNKIEMSTPKKITQDESQLFNEKYFTEFKKLKSSNLWQVIASTIISPFIPRSNVLLKKIYVSKINVYNALIEKMNLLTNSEGKNKIDDILKPTNIQRQITKQFTNQMNEFNTKLQQMQLNAVKSDIKKDFSEYYQTQLISGNKNKNQCKDFQLNSDRAIHHQFVDDSFEFLKLRESPVDNLEFDVKYCKDLQRIHKQYQHIKRQIKHQNQMTIPTNQMPNEANSKINTQKSKLTVSGKIKQGQRCKTSNQTPDSPVGSQKIFFHKSQIEAFKKLLQKLERNYDQNCEVFLKGNFLRRKSFELDMNFKGKPSKGDNLLTIVKEHLEQKLNAINELRIKLQKTSGSQQMGGIKAIMIGRKMHKNLTLQQKKKLSGKLQSIEVQKQSQLNNIFSKQIKSPLKKRQSQIQANKDEQQLDSVQTTEQTIKRNMYSKHSGAVSKQYVPMRKIFSQYAQNENNDNKNATENTIAKNNSNYNTNLNTSTQMSQKDEQLDEVQQSDLENEIEQSEEECSDVLDSSPKTDELDNKERSVLSAFPNVIKMFGLHPIIKEDEQDQNITPQPKPQVHTHLKKILFNVPEVEIKNSTQNHPSQFKSMDRNQSRRISFFEKSKLKSKLHPVQPIDFYKKRDNKIFNDFLLNPNRIDSLNVLSNKKQSMYNKDDTANNKSSIENTLELSHLDSSSAIQQPIQQQLQLISNFQTLNNSQDDNENKVRQQQSIRTAIQDRYAYILEQQQKSAKSYNYYKSELKLRDILTQLPTKKPFINKKSNSSFSQAAAESIENAKQQHQLLRQKTVGQHNNVLQRKLQDSETTKHTNTVILLKKDDEMMRTYYKKYNYLQARSIDSDSQLIEVCPDKEAVTASETYKPNLSAKHNGSLYYKTEKKIIIKESIHNKNKYQKKLQSNSLSNISTLYHQQFNEHALQLPKINRGLNDYEDIYYQSTLSRQQYHLQPQFASCRGSDFKNVYDSKQTGSDYNTQFNFFGTTNYIKGYM